MQLEPGFHLFQHTLAAEDQRRLWDVCRGLADGAVPMYTPTVRGGKKMSVGMLCLGRHWNALTYRYEDARSDFDGLRVPPIPVELETLATAAALRAGFAMRPDVCIMNFYDQDSRMGVHQDKDESPESIEAGVPIVSVSIGDTARFVVGGLSRKESDESAAPAFGRHHRDGRPVAAAVPRCDPDSARHRARRHRSWHGSI